MREQAGRTSLLPHNNKPLILRARSARKIKGFRKMAEVLSYSVLQAL